MDGGRASDESLRAEYSEVAANFRMLADIRFKLLAFLPIGSAVAVVVASDGVGPGAAAFLGLFGGIVTVCLMAYNARNDQHHDELIGRAKEIEARLGLPEGSFRNRPGRWLAFSGVPIEHGWPIRGIYFASIAAWVSLLVQGTVGVVALPRHPGWAAGSFTAALVICCVVYGAFERRKSTRKKEVHGAAGRAMKIVVDAIAKGDGELSASLLSEVAIVVGPDAKKLSLAAWSESHSHWLKGVPAEDRERFASYALATLIKLPPRSLRAYYLPVRGPLGGEGRSRRAQRPPAASGS